MTQHRVRILAAAGAIFALGLLAWTFRDVSATELWRHARQADAGWLVAMVAGAIATQGIRALRWRLLLPEEGAGLSLSSRFRAVCIGFMANTLFPVRLGEFARALALTRTSRLRLSQTLGSLVAERVLDGVVLVGFLASGLWILETSALVSTAGVADIRQLAMAMAMVFGLLACGMTLFVVARRWAEAMSRRVLGTLVSAPRAAAIGGVLVAFGDGVAALRGGGRIARALLWTVALWLVGALSILCGLRAFGIVAPGLQGAVLLQGLVAFAVAVPSSPGFFGPLEAAFRVGLALFGTETGRAVSFAMAFHVLTFLPLTLLGVLYAHRLGIGWGQIREGRASDAPLSSAEVAASPAL